MRKILIPLDGSSFAEEALSSGLDLLRQGELQIILFTCLDINGNLPPNIPGFPYSVMRKAPETEEAYEGYLEKQVTPLIEAGHSVKFLMRWGIPVEEILKVAQEEQVDQIIMSSHGHSGLKRLFIGSVAEGVTRRANCAVLIVPPSERRYSASQPSQETP